MKMEKTMMESKSMHEEKMMMMEEGKDHMKGEMK